MNMLEVDKGNVMKPNTSISFKPFLDFIRTRITEDNSVRKELMGVILDIFKSYPELERVVPLENLSKYKRLMDLVYIMLTSFIEDENKSLWGLCVPMSPVLFYGTDPFYEILNQAISYDSTCSLEDANLKDFNRNRQLHFYAAILKRFYDIDYLNHGDLLRSIQDSRTQLERHFRLHLNTDFVHIDVKGDLPEIDFEQMRAYAMAEDNLSTLHAILPMNMFELTGMTIITVTDVTPQYALDEIRDNVIRNKTVSGSNEFTPIIQSLKELVGSNEVVFNILPLFKVNGRLIDDLNAYYQSILFSGFEKDGQTENRYLAMIEEFISNPRLLYYSDLDSSSLRPNETVRYLQRAGVKSYALFPGYYNNNLVGAIEVYSKEKGILTESMLSCLEPARGLLAQLMQNSVTAFEDEIADVIREKFTNLQHSVQWKFNEVAWRYIQNKKEKPGQQELEEISFENVYPLYGAVDIRNSTIERNEALHRDLVVQFDILKKVFADLKFKTNFWLLDEKIYAAGQWSEMLSSPAVLFHEVEKMNDFLEHDIKNFLVQFTDKRPELFALVEPYFKAIDETAGIAYQNRRQLESDIITVISSVNNYFDLLRDEVQQAYPCYFEKFRTDGVEYDIYIGQSITPDRPYSDIYLKNLQLMQLLSMAAIAKYLHDKLPTLYTPVETTQLIFIHPHPIDIHFRRDEKRFDVEGAYNIRYHIIKKRIDKVHLKDSSERLTQPGKIALVYFNQREPEEYINYIRYLQGKRILTDDLEYLELEELQGVAGLKALRVGVNVE